MLLMQAVDSGWFDYTQDKEARPLSLLAHILCSEEKEKEQQQLIRNWEKGEKN